MSTLSALAKFDDLMRCQKELSGGGAEEKFLIFLHQFELIKHDYQRMVDEAQDIQGKLDQQTQQTISIERKLNYARKMLETERKARRDAENEKTQLETKLESLRTLLINDNTMKDETRKHLQVLSTFAKKRKSNHQIDEEEFNDINSTGSFLSDLSLTQSGDDILDPKPVAHGPQKWKKHRPSLNNSNILNVSNKNRMSSDKRRSTRLSLLDFGPNDKIVTQTKLTIPANKYAPIIAEASIEPVPMTSSDEDLKQYYGATPQTKKIVQQEEFKTPMKTPTPMIHNLPKQKYYTPTAPTLHEINNLHEELYATVKKKTATISGKPHQFTSKTFLKPEACGHCSKKIRFGSVGLKCTECRTCIHHDCRERFTVACLPQNTTPNAVKTPRFLGTISEYSPSIAPMVPALIVHCVNEIETRGLNEAGLYRVSGSDRDVKALKERFLKNNGIPNLQEIDVHVLCGCVKDFLRSLSEPLIPLALWTTFSNAAQTIPTDDDENVNKDVYRAVERLPQPNRDTLAFLILHFQRIAEYPEVKMPLTNFAKIFGPTIVGYSSVNPDQHTVFAETQIQYSVMFSLLNIPTEYWTKFIVLDQVTPQEQKKAIDNYGSKFYSDISGTPSFKFTRKDRKFYNTPPYSANSKKKK
ncbi:rac GTPase-activating protein 1 isoform X1 [Chironomus tepperi]|uniref:rac GTPase-activating protein 1 isoform X1 n=1 Tax=Chironomus tepperi TaxID=113505 RepID=UPI00391FB479